MNATQKERRQAESDVIVAYCAGFIMATIVFVAGLALAGVHP